MNASSYLGHTVAIIVDRPLGSTHPDGGLVYPVNYGFVPGTRSGDGEELDAYVLGVDEPCVTFHGQCIAVIVREEDDDPKLVVVPEGIELLDSEIRSATHFQEQFFRSRLLRGAG